VTKKACVPWLLKIALPLAPIFLFSPSISGQVAPARGIGGPDDWTHHRLIFSNPGTADEAIRTANYGRWLKTVTDPRYVLQREKRDSGAKSALKPAQILPRAEAKHLQNDAEPQEEIASVAPDQLPRGLTRSPANPIATTNDAQRHGRLLPRVGDEPNSLSKDWSENMGSGAKTGLGMFPAKFSFAISNANCGNAAQPDFVVFNTGLAGLTTQASIVAYDNLYTGCTGTVPATYWAYNTGGTILTSVVLSPDGSQVAFAQSSSGGFASLVLLKWQASTTQSANMPGTPTAVTAANYRTCTAPCSVTLTFSGAANDSGSSVFCDYASDTIYVGDDSGRLHQFTGVFNGTPAETSGAWPVSVSLSALSSPVYDSASGRIFVGDYLLNSTSNCGPSGQPCGFFYAVNALTGAIAGTSTRLDFVFGIVDAPLVDSSAGRAYVFAGADGSFGSVSACGTRIPCSGVFQFPTNFTSGSGTETTLGPGYQFLLSGTFDNAYFSSANAASPTGHLYVVGNTGSANNTLYQVSISSNVMSIAATAGPAVSTNFTNGFFSAGLQVTEVFTGAKDYIFLGVLSFGAPAGCSGSLTNGCVMGFDVTSGSIGVATTPTGATAEAGGTSGIIIDNTSTFGGASNIYYTPLADQVCPTSGGTGGCAIQVSQASP
jgi:hypothetical protein